MKNLYNAYTLRDAHFDDVEELVKMRMELQYFIESCNKSLRTHSNKMMKLIEEEYLKDLNDDNVKIIVAIENTSSQIVGMGVGRIQKSEMVVPNLSGRIDDVWIEANHRKKGLCKQITRALLTFFKTYNVTLVSLDYVVGNEISESVWNNIGFKPVLTIANCKLDEALKNLSR